MTYKAVLACSAFYLENIHPYCSNLVVLLNLGGLQFLQTARDASAQIGRQNKTSHIRHDLKVVWSHKKQLKTQNVSEQRGHRSPTTGSSQAEHCIDKYSIMMPESGSNKRVVRRSLTLPSCAFRFELTLLLFFFRISDNSISVLTFTEKFLYRYHVQAHG